MCRPEFQSWRLKLLPSQSVGNVPRRRSRRAVRRRSPSIRRWDRPAPSSGTGSSGSSGAWCVLSPASDPVPILRISTTFACPYAGREP
ncbi:hypothetical protein VV02_01155 [Luteipulveratus mongoliensis]|uniref:Uncharacterized protein n=1 Tax=Luteipulveratus mongoliensis TaxID=571913 RepID=A0A0K1JDY9_9MICO|nr:hypothetical protein VV02_01155 [Luteipulveratus mongoliensis]